MKRHAVLLVLVVGTVVGAGVYRDPANPAGTVYLVDSNPIPLNNAIELIGRDYGGSSLNLPGIEIVQKPWADISGFEEGVSEVRITPTQPTSDDEVFATVSGWKPDPDFVLDYADVTVLGDDVRLDLYWHTRPPIPTILPVTLTSEDLGLAVVQGTGLANSQLSSVGVSNPIPLLPPVTHYVPSSFEGTRFEVKESLGTLAAGAYTLHVVSHDPVPGTASRTFVVHEAVPSAGFPWGDPDSALFKLLEP